MITNNLMYVLMQTYLRAFDRKDIDTSVVSHVTAFVLILEFIEQFCLNSILL